MILENLPHKINEAKIYAEKILKEQEPVIEEISEYNHGKILKAFQDERISTYHLTGSTGYGLGDSGREALDAIMAKVLGTEAAMVRGQFVSGTHAIASALFGVLRPGDHFLSVSGDPYDTLEEVIGVRGTGQGSLKELGVDYGVIPLSEKGEIQYSLFPDYIKPNTKMLILQRSRGYAWRNSIPIEQIAELVQYVRKHYPELIIFVDNCYGELVEKYEPGDVGVDLVAGSLIKNLGGTIAPTGGYVAGRKELVEKAACRLTAPGVGSDLGATLYWQLQFFQGLFFSPLTVKEALRGAIFSAAFWQALGFEVDPLPDAHRTDLIQAVKLQSKERMVAFCQGFQKGSPVDSHVLPIPSEMPGYEDEVIMSGGTFIQGATSEFSADGPLREPYVVYQQGGISMFYVKFGNILAAQALWEQGLLK